MLASEMWGRVRGVTVDADGEGGEEGSSRRGCGEERDVGFCGRVVGGELLGVRW